MTVRIRQYQLLPTLKTDSRIDLPTYVSVRLYTTVYWPGLVCHILCVTDDDHRVKLKPLAGHPDHHGDYVNASYVDVCRKTPAIVGHSTICVWLPPLHIGLLHTK